MANCIKLLCIICKYLLNISITCAICINYIDRIKFKMYNCHIETFQMWLRIEEMTNEQIHKEESHDHTSG